MDCHNPPQSFFSFERYTHDNVLPVRGCDFAVYPVGFSTCDSLVLSPQVRGCAASVYWSRTSSRWSWNWSGKSAGIPSVPAQVSPAQVGPAQVGPVGSGGPSTGGSSGTNTGQFAWARSGYVGPGGLLGVKALEGSDQTQLDILELNVSWVVLVKFASSAAGFCAGRPGGYGLVLGGCGGSRSDWGSSTVGPSERRCGVRPASFWFRPQLSAPAPV